MAKDGNTYAKRQRETLKRQKAQEKRERRKTRKDQAGNEVELTVTNPLPARILIRGCGMIARYDQTILAAA